MRAWAWVRRAQLSSCPPICQHRPHRRCQLGGLAARDALLVAAAVVGSIVVAIAGDRPGMVAPAIEAPAAIARHAADAAAKSLIR